MVYTRITQPGAAPKYAYRPGETLLWRLRGTVIPEVWHMSLLTLCVTMAACWCYDTLRVGRKQEALGHTEKLAMNLFKDMERVLQYFTGFVTFILGFFNSIVYNRWWHMRELVGNIVETGQNTALHIAVFFVKEPKNLKLPDDDNSKDPKGEGKEASKTNPDLILYRARRELLRLLALGQALAFQACHRVRDHEWLIRCGLLERDSQEHQALQQLNTPGYNEVFCWYLSKAHFYMESGMVEEKSLSTVLYSQRWAMLCSSNYAEDLMMHLNQQIPMAYTHLLELMTKFYVLITPVALVPSLLWVAIPVAPLVTLFFYGFFRLGTAVLMDPFQTESGFNTQALLTASLLNMESLERNVPLSWVARRRSLKVELGEDVPLLATDFLSGLDKEETVPPAPTPSAQRQISWSQAKPCFPSSTPHKQMSRDDLGEADGLRKRSRVGEKE
mmetsp:Transcript_15057/g.32413  ORF Transcript_15057/g.32413 Transcript_15057/m.32413 type:complete len:444 (+) Transcript_15057:170-1501(+)